VKNDAFVPNGITSLLSKRNVKAGVALGFLSFLHNNKAIMIVGIVMMVIGAVVSTFLGQVLVRDYT